VEQSASKPDTSTVFSPVGVAVLANLPGRLSNPQSVSSPLKSRGTAEENSNLKAKNSEFAVQATSASK
jgi:hypothetical protein